MVISIESIIANGNPVCPSNEFAAIAAEFDGLTGRVREQARAKHLSPARLATHETEFEKLHGELERMIANDFFEAKAGLVR